MIIFQDKSIAWCVLMCNRTYFELHTKLTFRELKVPQSMVTEGKVKWKTKREILLC